MLVRIIIMSVSLSIDALGVGVSYQMKGITLNGVARLLIGIVNMFVMCFSMFAGSKLLHYFPPQVTNIIGTSILVLVGAAFIRNALYGKEDSFCDLDHSKDINPAEAFLLGIALSADCLSVGIAAASYGNMTIILPICVGLMQALFLWIGKRVSQNHYLLKRFDGKKSGVLAGAILIFMGIIKNV